MVQTVSHIPEIKDCIETCNNCHKICLETLVYCLEKGGEHSQKDHIRLLADCSEICQTSANFMLRGSDLHNKICAACAVICQECADSCDRFPNDKIMQKCVDACRTCSEHCEVMGKQ